MAEDDDNKTEEPTGKKLEEARKEGDVLQSQEVKTASGMLAVLVMIWLVLPGMLGRMKGVLASMLENAGTLRADTPGGLHRLGAEISADLGLFLAIPFVLFIGIAVATHTVQVGWMFNTKKLMPDLNKINPLKGVKRWFSAQMAVDLVKNLAKLTVVAVICIIIIRPHIRELENLSSMPLDASLLYLHGMIIRLIFGVLMAVLVIAGGDWFWQRHSYYKRNRMTKQEVKDEHRQSEGDPMVKSRIRSLRMQRARQRMMAAVPKADVVITNPTHFACALKYDQATMKAPVLVAKGQDLVALRIRQIADENNIPIVENPPLARALYASVELDREIPPDHYKAVAEVITYVFKLRKTDRRYRR
jgi:flagellar biosynthetic protein FlhB